MSTVPPPQHPAITAYLDHLRAADKASTAATNRSYLALFEHWLHRQQHDVLHVTAAVMARYQLWIVNEHRTARGEPFAITTQATALLVLKSLYRWLTKRGMLLFDPTATMVPPQPPRRLVVAKEHLSLQEATALIDTLVALIAEATPNTSVWALRLRNCAVIALALATGRRCAGLCDVQVEDVDAARNELRVEREKGKTGRVLPMAAWAMTAVQRYVSQARPILLGKRTSPWLFVSQRADRLCERAVSVILDEAITETIARNSDLTGLPSKRISTHSLRVTFAVTMFANGCGIRSLNELMLHRHLTTTAAYTPIPLDDLRRVLLTTHPRA